MELSTQIVNAIGSTLFHSLWQGLILAVITGLIIVLTRSQKSVLRYNLLIVLMFAFFVATVITFINSMSSAVGTALAPSLNVDTLGSVVLKSQTGIAVPSTFFDRIINFLNHNNSNLVFIWLFIVLAKGLQLIAGLNGIKQLRSTAIFGIDLFWQQKVKHFAGRLKINQVIGLAESGLVKVPMVVGHLKPLILLPIGLLTALPQKEIEAILIHELAHIYRRDYLVNILQSLMEILFFFNPALLWLSALIKTERENCCDDIAVDLTSSKLNYINALVSCQEYQLASPAYAMAFSKKGQLKSRVIRLLHNHNQSLNVFEKSILACCLVMASLSLLAFANEAKIDKVVRHTTKVIKSTLTAVHSELTIKEDTLKSLKKLGKLNTSEDSIKDWRVQDSLKTVSQLQKINTRRAQQAELAVNVSNNISINFPDSILQSKTYRIDTPKLKTLATVLLPLNTNITIPSYTPRSEVYKPYKPKPKVELSQLIQRELIKDGIVGEYDIRSSFMLNREELIVNGKVQPQEVSEKYQIKFIPVTGSNQWSISRNFNDSRRTVKAPTN